MHIHKTDNQKSTMEEGSDVELKRCKVLLPGPLSLPSDSLQAETLNVTDNLIDNWRNLPAVPLVIVFSHLTDPDRAKAAAVCKNWYTIFHTAALWRNRRYRFGGFRSNRNEVDRMLGYARSFGTYLQTIRLSCNHPTFSTCKGLQRGLSNLFGILSWKKARVRHFQFNNLQTDRYWRYEFLRQRLATGLCRFLRHQRDIDCFEMSCATFPITLGLKIMERLSCSSGRRITALSIEDMFVSRAMIHQMNRFQQAMSNFSNLTTFQTNYNYVNEDILRTMCKNCGKNLTYLGIKAYRYDPHNHRIDGCTWRECKQSSPNLSVSFSFEGIGHSDQLIGMMNAEMPLTSLSIWTGLRHLDEDWEVGQTLTHVARSFGKILEDVSLYLETGEEVIDEQIMKLLEASHSLELLDIQAPVSVSTLERLCTMQEEHKLGLLKCHVTAENMTALDVEELEKLEKKYENMFDERGLDFRFMSADMVYPY